MATRYPREGPSLDQIGETSVVDPHLAESALLREIDDRQQALITGWGGAPFSKSVDWSATATTSTYYDVIRVPPGVEFVRAVLLASGEGEVTLTSLHDSTGTTLRWAGDETIEEAVIVSTSTEEDIDSADSGPPLRVAPGASYLWEWTSIDVTVSVTAESGHTAQIYGIAYIPLHRPTDDTAYNWAATSSLDLVAANSQYLPISGAEKHYNHPDGFTALAWVKSDDASSTQNVLTFGDASSQARFQAYQDTSGQVVITIHDGTDRVVRVEGGSIGTSWAHCAWTAQPSSNATGASEVYLNGSSVDDTDADAPTSDITALLDQASIGVRRDATTAAYWDGHILEVAIIARKLTDAEVAEAYNGGTPVDVRTLSFGAYVADYFVASVNSVDGSTVQFVNLGLAPTWNTATLQGSSTGSGNISSDVP